MNCRSSFSWFISYSSFDIFLFFISPLLKSLCFWPHWFIGSKVRVLSMAPGWVETRSRGQCHCVKSEMTNSYDFCGVHILGMSDMGHITNRSRCVNRILNNQPNLSPTLSVDMNIVKWVETSSTSLKGRSF